MRSNKTKKGLDGKKRLRLATETIRMLNNEALALVNGGDSEDCMYTNADCVTLDVECWGYTSICW